MKRTWKQVISLVLIGLVSVAAGTADTAKTIRFLSIWPETTDNSKLILDLTKEYQKTHPQFKVDFELIDTNSLQQKVKVLLASNDLPEAFAYESGKPILELIDAGKVVNITTPSIREPSACSRDWRLIGDCTTFPSG
jgi:ABC-type glycerol-3-phosphate transport system substrate-binding protein